MKACCKAFVEKSWKCWISCKKFMYAHNNNMFISLKYFSQYTLVVDT